MVRCHLREEVLLQCQKEQFRHDRLNHSDILSLHKTDRLKHYGLHFSKYVGRLARGSREPKSVSQTTVDAFLVCLSAANTLHQRLVIDLPRQAGSSAHESFLSFADAAGRFADACEKIDHLETFVPMALEANADMLQSIVDLATLHQVDLLSRVVKERRDELAARHFYSDVE